MSEGYIKKPTIRNWIKNFKAGKYEEEDVNVQIAAGWFDWTCFESSLPKKTKKLGHAICMIKDGGKVDLDRTYVCFRNSFPLRGKAYDSFRICSTRSGKVYFSVLISKNIELDGLNYHIYGMKNGFKEPLHASENIRGAMNWFNKPWESKRKK